MNNVDDRIKYFMASQEKAREARHQQIKKKRALEQQKKDRENERKELENAVSNLNKAIQDLHKRRG